MDYGYVIRLTFYQDLGVPRVLVDPIETFHSHNNDWSHSDSAAKHLGEGWFVLYDYPLAERDASEKGRLTKIPQFSDHHLVYFSDLKQAMEYKLRWC